MRVFISGGCKNGKSSHAERIAVLLAEGSRELYYIATMQPTDDEDRERIARHRQSRSGLGFETIELAGDIVQLQLLCDTSGVFLLDSVTALLANEMFPPSGAVNVNAYAKVADELLGLLGTLDNMVIVSDYIYSDAAVYDELTASYRKGLAYIDKACAKACDVVLEVCCGSLIVHKGREAFGRIDEKIA